MEETTRNEELNNQILESLERINQNTVKTNNAIDDLQEYLILQDQKKEEKEKETEEKSSDSDDQDKQEETEEVAESSSATSEDTYEVLVQIRDEQRLTNQMFAGSFLISGIICGVLLFKILWDKLT